MFGFISNIFPESNLCNNKGIKIICDRFSPKLVEQSIDSAHAINLCLHLVQDWYETCSYEELFKYIHHRLINGHMVDYSKSTCKIRIGEEYFDNLPIGTGEIKYFEYSQPTGDLAKAAFNLMISKWIYYYSTRLPIMLNGTTYNKKHLSKNEKFAITDKCFEEIKKTPYYNIYNIRIYFMTEWSDDYLRAYEMRSEDEKMSYINDYSWFFQDRPGKNALIPKIRSLSVNQRFLLFTLLDKYFHIFYHSLQDYFADYCMQAAYLQDGFNKD